MVNIIHQWKCENMSQKGHWSWLEVHRRHKFTFNWGNISTTTCTRTLEYLKTLSLWWTLTLACSENTLIYWYTTWHQLWGCHCTLRRRSAYWRGPLTGQSAGPQPIACQDTHTGRQKVQRSKDRRRLSSWQHIEGNKSSWQPKAVHFKMSRELQIVTVCVWSSNVTTDLFLSSAAHPSSHSNLSQNTH
jgi:hypothetical protein